MSLLELSILIAFVTMFLYGLVVLVLAIVLPVSQKPRQAWSHPLHHLHMPAELPNIPAPPPPSNPRGACPYCGR